MTSFRDLPIRRKLSAAFLSTTLSALLLACGAFVTYEMVTFRRSMVRNLGILADALGKNSTGALRFAGQTEAAKTDAEETLQALSFEPSVVAACLYTEENEWFAGYASSEREKNFPAHPQADGPRFEGNHLVLFRPVVLNGKRIGTIYLKASLDDINHRIRSYMIISGLVLLGALLLALGLSSALRHLILQPILNLAQATRLIAGNRDYSVRVKGGTRDELGQLTNSFNQMLAEIQERDSSLKRTNLELQQEAEARGKAEHELKMLNEQLEQRVEERTRDLQKSNQELEQFAYVASHDLQEPLRMVGSFMQLLERRYKGKLDADADQYIGFAVDGAKRMQSLIQDLLTYSRVDSRGAPLEATHLQSILDRVLLNLKVAIEESQAVITQDAMPTLMADGSQLTQLFQNLIANAIKFRSQETPRVHIGAKQDGRWCQFSVTDNGIGIENKFYERIFVLFQRLHNRSEYPGTGIGLAVCKKIVERHRGRIWVESEPGHGTAFHFTIPNSPAATSDPRRI